MTKKLYNTNKRYVVGTQMNHLSETVVLRTQTYVKEMNRKILIILSSNILLMMPMLQMTERIST